jgi:hypothetical protein
MALSAIRVLRENLLHKPGVFHIFMIKVGIIGLGEDIEQNGIVVELDLVGPI